MALSLWLDGLFEWKVWNKEGLRPRTMPSNPSTAYSEALLVARAADLASAKEWQLWCRGGMRPPSMPAHPDVTYKLDGWRGWRHWLGTESGASAPPQAAAAGQQRGSRKRKR